MSDKIDLSDLDSLLDDSQEESNPQKDSNKASNTTATDKKSLSSEVVLQKLKTNKKKIIGVIFVILMMNIATNLALTVPLAFSDFKLLYIRYNEAASTKSYSVIEVKALAKNNFFMPAKIGRINFEIYESGTNGIIGDGYLSPISVDPGQITIIDAVIKLYKTESTVRFVRSLVKDNKFNAKIKVYYPITFFGLFELFKVPLEVDLSSLMSSGSNTDALSQYSFSLPSFEVKSIELTKEDPTYAEAKVEVYGLVPVELSGIGKVSIDQLDIDITTSYGRVIEMKFDPFVMDSNIGSFTANLTLRFIKGQALKVFLERAIKWNQLTGKVKAKVALKIFDVPLRDLEYEEDLSKYSGFFSTENASSKETGSVFGAISKMLSNMFQGITLEYLGRTATTAMGDEHKFRLDVKVYNPTNWTLGWDNININITKSIGILNETTAIWIKQEEPVLLKPNQTTNVDIFINLYDNNALHDIIREALYMQKYDFNITGYLDVYFAGVWLRGVSINSPVGSMLTGESSTTSGLLGGAMPIGNMNVAGKYVQDFEVKSYDILSYRDKVVLKTKVSIVYPRLPIAIYNVSGNVFYDKDYIGSIYVDRIELSGNEILPYVKTSAGVEIKLKKNSPTVTDFISSFIRGDWTTKTSFVGTFDLVFLGRYYPNVPIRLGGDVLNGLSGSSAATSSVSMDFYSIENLTYLGTETINGNEAHVLLVDTKIDNPLSSDIQINQLDLKVFLDTELYPEAFAEIIVENSTLIPGSSSAIVPVRVYLYSNDALEVYLNRTVQGLNTSIRVEGALDIDIGGLKINTTSYKTRIASSMMGTVTESVQFQYSMFYKSIELLNMTGYPDMVVIYAKVNTTISLPLEIPKFVARISLYKNTTDYPAVIEIVDPIKGPGEHETVVRIVLYNTSEEFIDFVKYFVYGDNDLLYLDLSLDIDIFGYKFDGVVLRDLPLNTSVGAGTGGEQSESLFSLIKFDNNILGSTSFSYNGRTIVDGTLAYNFTVTLGFRNIFGISLKFGDATIRVSRHGSTLVLIEIRDTIVAPPKGESNITANIYVLESPYLKGFLEDLIINKRLDADIEGNLYIRIFGVDLPGVKFAYHFASELAQESGMNSYYDVSLMYGASLKTFTVLYDSQEQTIIHAELEITNLTLPAEVYQAQINIGLPWYSDPVFIVRINSTVDLEKNPIRLPVDLKIIKSDKEHLKEFLQRIINSELDAVSIWGSAKISIFGVTLDLPIELYNLSFAPTSGGAATTIALPNIAYRLDNISYDGVVTLGNSEAHKLSVRLAIDNTLGINFGVGPFNVVLKRDNVSVVQVEIPDYYIFENGSESILVIDLYFYRNEKTYEFLNDLIANFTFNASLEGEGTISIFDVTLDNVHFVYSVFMELAKSVSANATTSGASIPFPALTVRSYLFDVIEENDSLALLNVDVNFTNPLVMPFKLWSLNVTLIRNNTPTFGIDITKTLDLSIENISARFSVRIYKNNETIQMIRSLVLGKLENISITGKAGFQFLDWNFTIDINLTDFSGLGSGSGGSMGALPPLGFNDIITITKVRQISSNGIRIYLNLKNIVNTTLGLGNLNFEIYHGDERVIYGVMPEYYLIDPLANATVYLDIYFEQTSETQKFLEDILIKNIFNATFYGVTDVYLFGLNITKLNLAEYVFMDLSGSMSGSSSASTSNLELPYIKEVEILGSKFYGDYLDIDLHAVLSESPLTFSLYNLNLALENEEGMFGRLIINNMSAIYGSDINVYLTLRLYNYDNNKALEKVIIDAIEKGYVALEVNGTTDIEFFGFRINGVPLNIALNTSTQGEGAGNSNMASFVIPMDKILLFDSFRQLTFGPTAYTLEVNASMRNILDGTLMFGDLNISIDNNNTQIISILASDMYTLSHDKYTNLNMLVTLYDVPELKQLIEAFISGENTTIRVVGSVDIGLLGAYIDDLNINMTYTLGGNSTVGDVGANLVGFSSLSTGQMVLTNIDYLGEDGLWARTAISANISEFPLYLEIYYANITIGNSYGKFINILIQNHTVFNVSSTGKLDLLLSVLKGSEGLKEFLYDYLKDGTPTVDIEGNISIRLFSPTTTNLYLNISLDYKNFALEGGSAATSTAGSIASLPISGNIEVKKAEKVGSAGEGYLLLDIIADLRDAPLPLTIEDLNITIFSEYLGDWGAIMNVFVPRMELKVKDETTSNITVKIFDRFSNNYLAMFIRNLVEKKLLYMKIQGSANITIFGVTVDQIPINITINQTLEGTSAGDNLGNQFTLFFPLDNMFVFKSIEQYTPYYLSGPYGLTANIALKSPINTTIGIGDIDLYIIKGSETALRILTLDQYWLGADSYTNMSIDVKFYDTVAAKELIEDITKNKILNATIFGEVDLDFLGAHINDLRLNFTVTQNLSASGGGFSEAATLTDPGITYKVLNLSLDEDGTYAYINVTLDINGSPIYMYLYDLNITISSGDSQYIWVNLDEPAELVTTEGGTLSLKIRIKEGSTELENFINAYLKGESYPINITGRAYLKLFGSNVENLIVDIPIELSNVAYGGESSSSAEGPLVPLDLSQYFSVSRLELINDYYDEAVGYRGYTLLVDYQFTNKLNVSFSVAGLNLTLLRNSAPIIKGYVDSLSAPRGTNVTSSLYITLYDRPETAAFLEDILDNYQLNFEVSVYVESISIFGITIYDLNMSQVMGMDVSRQVEGSQVQSNALSVFNISVGGLKVLGEDINEAQLQINVSFFDALITVYIENLDVYLRYQGTSVAHVFTNYLSIVKGSVTNVSVILSIFKDNKTALQGFLNDLLVRKNVTMDIWGSLTINLFGSEYLILDMDFKFNRTNYAVEDYYGSLTSGEVDSSAMLESVISYSAEDVAWEFLGENDTHVSIRLSEAVESQLNLKIYHMESYLYMDYNNSGSLFGIQRLVGWVNLVSGSSGNITIDIIFLKNQYLQQFMDGVLHDWTINAWIDTTIDLEIFGVNITGLRAVSVKYSFVITSDTIQNLINSNVDDYTGSMNSTAVELDPIGYGNWYDPNDLYGGIDTVVNDVLTYTTQVWNQDPTTINVWDYQWILLKYNQTIGTYDFRVSLLNFKAIMVFTGNYTDGGVAEGTPETDFIGEIYIDNLTLVPDANNTFIAYVRFWRVNRFNNFENSSLKDFMWAMINQVYNFSVVNVTFDLEMWGCYIQNVTLDRLNFTGAMDLSDLSNTIQFKGMTSYSIYLSTSGTTILDVYFTASFKIEVPKSPEWLVYYAMLLSWDDDPIYFEDTDSVTDDPPSTGSFQDTGLEIHSEAEELLALDPNAQPLGHDRSVFWEAPLITDAPTSLPSYVKWFGGGGEYELPVLVNIEVTDGFHDYIGNAYLDQQYNDEDLTAQGQPEVDDGSLMWSIWENQEDGDDWCLVLFSYEVEILMFWWVIYYYQPSFYIASGDYNPHVAHKSMWINKTWYISDANGIYNIKLYGGKVEVNGAKVFDIQVSGQMFMDIYDGEPDTSEPDYSGNYRI